MNRIIHFFIAMLVCTSCYRLPFPILDETSHYEDRVLVSGDPTDLSEIIWDYVTQLKYTHHLHLQHSFVIAEETRSKFHIEFITQDILELCQARQLLVDTVEGLLAHINSSPAAFQLRPSPFTANDLELYIDFESYHGRFADPYYIGWIALEEGMSYFYAFTLKNKLKDFWHQRYEPYYKSRAWAYQQREAEQKYSYLHAPKKKKAMLEERY